MWHQWFNRNFMKLREYFLCTKKTKITTLFNNLSPPRHPIAPFWRVSRCARFSKCKQSTAHACSTSTACVVYIRGKRTHAHTVHYCYSSLPTFLKRVDFYKAHRSEKRGVLWLASYPVRCDWPNASSVWRKCYAPLPYLETHSVSMTTILQQE